MAAQPEVLIVEDHPLFRDALAMAVSQARPSGASIRVVDGVGAALQALAEAPADLVLLDLNLSDANGFDGLARIQSHDATLAVVIVSATEGENAYRTAKSLGARGYLPKSSSPEALCEALAALLDGGEWHPEVAGLSPANDAIHRVASLTPAQRRVLSGLAAGLLNKQIAFEMGISEATVKAHMTAIFRKLGANNRTQALLAFKKATSLDDYSAA